MIPQISPLGLVLSFVPTVIVIGIMVYSGSIAKTAIYATCRMLVQLLLIGYVLVYIFETDHWFVIISVLLVMLFSASWIAIRTLSEPNSAAYLHALCAIAAGGVTTLGLITQLVVGVEPWFSPQYLVPLAGMIFAGSMNAVSLAAERFEAETARGEALDSAKRTAFQAALIPIINSLFAVGIVALPGMMTGQILSGVSPIVAAQYQIVVMSMLFGATGISAAVYLALQNVAPARPT